MGFKCEAEGGATKQSKLEDFEEEKGYASGNIHIRGTQDGVDFLCARSYADLPNVYCDLKNGDRV
ncbi:hypothetical protein ACFYV7_09700 [Nocardia suismassiliense]|uniref:Uncharacterized protein n=1 Tax=Nocardia suismassiliense TaxID=2077092 RepID=A0ABW6QPB8_9NOCA